MTDNSHNSMGKLINQIQQLRQAEVLLLKGTTVAELAGTLGCSTKQARRIIAAMRELGCPVTDDFVAGMREAATYKLAASGRRGRQIGRK
jgi:predicted DNA-binding transcriptional regulator YafY